ncbi:hypothetical protein EH223_00450 [candidate division KSB1 bacterium]|nr:hypothetical protein [candidate division KSB1 bacterium]RQW07121.1 MAG: hypothetical protein EH223_00450 [candidate division KSB1 bacterium]
MKSHLKIDVRAILMLLFGLVAVLAIMLQVQRMTPKPPPELAKLGSERIGVVDSTYINHPLRFAIKMPNRFWLLSVLTQDTVLNRLDSNQMLHDQIVWLLSSKRVEANDTLALCKVGGILLDREKSSTELAINYLAEIISKHEQPGVRVHVVQHVTSPAHQVLKGAYFMVNVPDVLGVTMPVRVVALLPRGERLYIIESKTTDAFYPVIREELQEIVQRFFPLPLLTN